MKYTHRYIARVTLEAQTALFVGSGNQGLLQDALVQKDHHGLPMIQGSSLTGVLRHSLEDQATEGELKHWNQIFGFQKDKDGAGAQLRISSAYLLLPNRDIAEGLTPPPSDILKEFETLPLRQHVRINHKGAAEENGLFNNQVIFKGCQFKFELELRGDATNKDAWNKLLQKIGHPLFRIGQGTRNGYGKLQVTECIYRIFDLAEKEKSDFNDYLNFNPSLNETPKGFNAFDFSDQEDLLHFHLQLEPDDSFFIFGSGKADETADQTPVTEKVLSYKDGEFDLPEHTLIPASSIKGALSHRTCFHYNRLTEKFSDQLLPDEYVEHIGINNKAVRFLFGFPAEGKEKEGHRGRVIMDDVYYQNVDSKIFNHVAIDRFTGGAIDGALFSERVNHTPIIELDIWLEEKPEDEKFWKRLNVRSKTFKMAFYHLVG